MELHYEQAVDQQAEQEQEGEDIDQADLPCFQAHSDQGEDKEDGPESPASDMNPRRLRYSEFTLEQPGARMLKVYARVRPHAQAVSCMTSTSPTTIAVPGAASKRQGVLETYSFSHVLDQAASQAEVYRTMLCPLVEDLVSFRSRNNVLMAYGASGTGKTFTIQGTAAAPGLVPRALQRVFLTLKGQPCMIIQLSFYEVYDNRVYDLLRGVSAGRAAARQALEIKVLNQAAYVPGLTQKHCTTVEEAAQLYADALRLRKQAATGVNAESSRSHAVFTIAITETIPPASGQCAMARSASLSIVDLAGTERAARTGNFGRALKESAAINSSLMTLGRCLHALRHNQVLALAKQQQQQQAAHIQEPPVQAEVAAGADAADADPAGAVSAPVLLASGVTVQASAAATAAAGTVSGIVQQPRVIPVRETSITHIFKEVLQGQGSLVLSVHVSAAAEDIELTRQALKFASLAARVSVLALPAQAVALAPLPVHKATAGAREQRDTRKAGKGAVMLQGPKLAGVCGASLPADVKLQGEGCGQQQPGMSVARRRAAWRDSSASPCGRGAQLDEDKEAAEDEEAEDMGKDDEQAPHDMERQEDEGVASMNGIDAEDDGMAEADEACAPQRSVCAIERDVHVNTHADAHAGKEAAALHGQVAALQAQIAALEHQLGVVESDAREVVAAEMEELLQAKREQVDELQEQVRELTDDLRDAQAESCMHAARAQAFMEVLLQHGITVPHVHVEDMDVEIHIPCTVNTKRLKAPVRHPELLPTTTGYTAAGTATASGRVVDGADADLLKLAVAAGSGKHQQAAFGIVAKMAKAAGAGRSVRAKRGKVHAKRTAVPQDTITAVRDAADDAMQDCKVADAEVPLPHAEAAECAPDETEAGVRSTSAMQMQEQRGAMAAAASGQGAEGGIESCPTVCVAAVQQETILPGQRRANNDDGGDGLNERVMCLPPSCSLHAEGIPCPVQQAAQQAQCQQAVDTGPMSVSVRSMPGETGASSAGTEAGVSVPLGEKGREGRSGCKVVSSGSGQGHDAATHAAAHAGGRRPGRHRRAVRCTAGSTDAAAVSADHSAEPVDASAKMHVMSATGAAADGEGMQAVGAGAGVEDEECMPGVACGAAGVAEEQACSVVKERRRRPKRKCAAATVSAAVGGEGEQQQQQQPGEVQTAVGAGAGQQRARKRRVR